ncbi:glycosyltransferase family 1 protein [Scytonema sp. PCC 10023]|uniref:glycosyltransferase family 1 protein n=1 Tax=Scytonema sp. PCC 10023 TaxID=1680591 RepID=UPI0039C60E4F
MHYKSSKSTLKSNENPTLAHERSIRILHVVAGMNRGGIETWLMDFLRQTDRDRFQMDFLVHTTQPCAYDEEIRALNSQIIPCLHPSRPWTYTANFKRILREYGPYDIVHSHVYLFSGYVLRLAQQAGIPVRIAHTHTDTSSIEARAGLYRRVYHTLAKWLINRHATVGLGMSRKAVADLFGAVCETDPRWQAIYYGIDMASFRDVIDPVAMRAEFGIPADAFVIGHVGRFVKVKNHTFILDIAAEVAKREPKMRLLLVGDGPLRPEIQHKAAEIGLADRIIFAGVRSDVPRVMQGAMDVFLFPSLYEGLGNVRLEAQAAGLPCVVSNTVPNEGDVVKPLVQRLCLSQPASAWAEVILAMNKGELGITPTQALAVIAQSPFNIQNSVQSLEKIYLNNYSQSLSSWRKEEANCVES